MKLFSTFALLMIFSAGLSLASGLEEHDALIELAKDKESDFDAALADAERGEMNADWLLEAEIVRALATSDLAAMTGLISRIDAVGENFRYGVGRDFYSAQQLQGFADTLRCVVAYQSQDMESFEKYAVRSFENAPGFNSAFGIADLLARQRMQAVQDEAMADFRVPMDMVLANVEGESKTLKEWMGDDKAMLIDFWASWCGPCIRLMPSLKEKEAKLSKQGIFVAGVNTDQRDQLKNAQQVRERQAMDSVPWLLDRNGGDLSGMLMIDSIPRMVLVDREGRVQYNGHPMDPSLNEALASFGVDL